MQKLSIFYIRRSSINPFKLNRQVGIVMQRVAITKNGLDIGRIILGSEHNGNYDFKLNFFDNIFELRLVQLFRAPFVLNLNNSNHWELTYHKSANSKPPCVHLKHKSKEQPDKYPKVDKHYKPLDLRRLSEPTVITDFPIPLFKIVVPDNISASPYLPNPKNHIVLDMDSANTAEVYLTHTSFDYGLFLNKWPSLHLNLMSHAIEFFATNDIKYTANKANYFLPEGDEIRLAATSFEMNKDIRLYVNLFHDSSHLLDNNQIQVTFLENEFAVALLGLTSMCFELNEKKRYSYEIDLYERNPDSFTTKEREKWNYRFKKSKESLDKELSRHSGLLPR